MKYIKFLIINIIAFSIFFLLFSLLFPSVVHTSKTINIGADEKKIAENIRNTDTWKRWNEFVRSDSVRVNLMNNSTDTIITELVNNKGQKRRAIFIIINDHSDSTIVNWNLEERIRWYEPWKKFAAVLSESKYGYAMEISLGRLKKQMETLVP